MKIAKSKSQRFQIAIQSRDLKSQSAQQSRSRIASKSAETPKSSFPLFFISCLFPFQGSPCDFKRFPSFPKDFRGSASTRNPCFFGGFPCCFPKRQGKEDQGVAWKSQLKSAIGQKSQRFNRSDFNSLARWI